MQKLLNGFFILFLSFSATAEQASEKNADLYAAIKAFDHAYATNEVEKYFSLYADDATAYFGDGRVDIAAYHTMWIALMAAGGGVEIPEKKDLTSASRSESRMDSHLHTAYPTQPTRPQTPPTHSA